MSTPPDDPREVNKPGETHPTQTPDITTEKTQKKEENNDKTQKKDENNEKTQKKEENTEKNTKTSSTNASPAPDSNSSSREKMSYAHAATGSGKHPKFTSTTDRTNYFFEYNDVPHQIRNQYNLENEKVEVAGTIFSPTASLPGQQNLLTHDHIIKAFNAEKEIVLSSKSKDSFDFTKPSAQLTDEELEYIAIRDAVLAHDPEKPHIYMAALVTGIIIRDEKITSNMVETIIAWIAGSTFHHEDVRFTMQQPQTHKEGTLLAMKVSYHCHSFDDNNKVLKHLEQTYQLESLSNMFTFEEGKYQGFHFLASLKGEKAPPYVVIPNVMYVRILNTTKKCTSCNSINHFRSQCNVYCTFCKNHGHFLQKCRSYARYVQTHAERPYEGSSTEPRVPPGYAPKPYSTDTFQFTNQAAQPAPSFSSSTSPADANGFTTVRRGKASKAGTNTSASGSAGIHFSFNSNPFASLHTEQSAEETTDEINTPSSQFPTINTPSQKKKRKLALMKSSNKSKNHQTTSSTDDDQFLDDLLSQQQQGVSASAISEETAMSKASSQPSNAASSTADTQSFTLTSAPPSSSPTSNIATTSSSSSSPQQTLLESSAGTSNTNHDNSSESTQPPESSGMSPDPHHQDEDEAMDTDPDDQESMGHRSGIFTSQGSQESSIDSFGSQVHNVFNDTPVATPQPSQTQL